MFVFILLAKLMYSDLLIVPLFTVSVALVGFLTFFNGTFAVLPEFLCDTSYVKSSKNWGMVTCLFFMVTKLGNLLLVSVKVFTLVAADSISLVV
jgi:hypothetical protein